MGANKPPIDPHEAVQKIILNEHYSEQIHGFSSETFRILLNDQEKALEQAQKTVSELEPENLNAEYIGIVADAMQELATKVLHGRAKKETQRPKK